VPAGRVTVTPAVKLQPETSTGAELVLASSRKSSVVVQFRDHHAARLAEGRRVGAEHAEGHRSRCDNRQNQTYAPHSHLKPPGLRAVNIDRVTALWAGFEEPAVRS
jgi:hypothetical protein